MKKYILIILLVLSLTGCLKFSKNDKVPTKEETIEYINNKYGANNTILEVEELPTTGEKHETKGNKYKVHSELGFDYIVESGINYSVASGGLGSGYIRYFKDTFYEELIKNKQSEIEPIFNKYSIVDATYKINNSKLLININLNNNLNNVELANEFLYKLRKQFKEEYNILNMDDVIVRITYNDKVLSDIKFKYIDSLDIESHKNNIKYYFLYEGINNTNTSDSKVVLNKLYINNKEFTSDKYKVKFVYEPTSKEYLAIVGYGLELSYNGGEKDYLQREIITNYLNGNYTIYKALRKSKYNIGNNKYEVYFPRNNDGNIKDGYYFKKNGKKLDIKVVDKPIYYGHTGASYFYYIKLSDWAYLLDCDYSIQGDTVYLTSK